MDRFSKSEVSQLVALRRKTIGKCEEGCSDGWISKGKEQSSNEAQELVPCDCRKVFLYLKELVFAKIPNEYWNLELAELTITPNLVLAEVGKYFKYFRSACENGLSFCFLGVNGIGKTSLLAEVGKKAVLEGLSTVYLTSQDYINLKMLNDYEAVERVEEKSDVVLLDELDKPYRKKGSDYVITQMENFFRKTLPRNRMVHLASNWSKEMIKKHLGESVYSIMNRKMRFLTLLGEDLSEDINKNWSKKLVGQKVTYLNEYLVGMARKMKRFSDD